ncbi:type II secretion system protein N [Reinekea forsetii]|nr:type II secretion system protein N [Reinekea forsetii]
MKYLNFKYILLFVVAYIIALAALFPVRWVIPSVSPMLASVGLSVNQVDGSIWLGKAFVKHKQLGDINLQWQAKPLHLFRLALPMQIEATGRYFDVKALVAPSVFGIRVSDVTGYVDEQAVQPFLQPYRVTLQGRLQLDGIAAESSWKYELGEASGQLTYSGGPIRIPVGRSIETYEVPTMLGELSSNEKQWQLQINSTDQQTFIDVNLERSGLATLSVKRTLAEVMDIPLPAGGRSLFDVSQQVF